MADVIGACSTLPGACRPVPKGAMCDVHPDRPALFRVQGETDSFGAELNDMCQECYDQNRAFIEEERLKPAYCEWCEGEKMNVHPHRDWEEGSCGRLYDVCGDCRSKESAALAEELESDDRRIYYDDVFDDHFDDHLGAVDDVDCMATPS